MGEVTTILVMCSYHAAALCSVRFSAARNFLGRQLRVDRAIGASVGSSGGRTIATVSRSQGQEPAAGHCLENIACYGGLGVLR